MKLENYKTIGKIAFIIAELMILIFVVFVIREVIITKKFSTDIIGFAGVLIYSQLGILFTVWGVPGAVNFAKKRNPNFIEGEIK